MVISVIMKISLSFSLAIIFRQWEAITVPSILNAVK